MMVQTRRSTRKESASLTLIVVNQDNLRTTNSTMKRKARRSPSASASSSPQGSPHPSSPSSPLASSSHPIDKSARNRRPIRPVDRQKMRDWLETILNEERMQENIWWMQRGKVFAVRWSHASGRSFSVKDRTVFKGWAEHTGIYKDGDEPDHKKWKSNFRCAIHSVKDIEEITEKDGRKGENAARVYRLLDTPKTRDRKRTLSDHQPDSEDKQESSKMEVMGDDSQMKGHGLKCWINEDGLGSPPLIKADTSNIAPTCSKLPKLSTLVSSSFDFSNSNNSNSSSHSDLTTCSSSSNTSSNIPNFERLGFSSSGAIVQQNHLNGGFMTIKEEPKNLTSTSMPHFIPASESVPSISSTSQFPIPVPVTFNLKDLNIHDIEMKPVGIQTITRTRTTSGDSGHPCSPQWAAGEEIHWNQSFNEEITNEPDEGIGLNYEMLMPAEILKSVINPGEKIHDQLFSVDNTDLPEPVLTQVITSCEDFNLTGYQECQLESL